jgi:hypothetical protein
MAQKKKSRKTDQSSKPMQAVNPGRHEYHCKVCSHAERRDIEEAFISWVSPGQITKHYGVSRDSVYRHAHAMGLMEKRRRNVRCALERIIERAGDVEVSATAVVSAVAAYAKINSAGQWIDRTEQVNLNELFERMTREELELYAKEGILPAWFEGAVGATGAYSRGDKNEH